jgi:hypothetical protein
MLILQVEQAEQEVVAHGAIGLARRARQLPCLQALRRAVGMRRK